MKEQVADFLGEVLGALFAGGLDAFAGFFGDFAADRVGAFAQKLRGDTRLSDASSGKPSTLGRGAASHFS